MARVRRRDFFAIDREKLPYLNGLEKLNCLYCSYANGVIGFVREVAARTRQLWYRSGMQPRCAEPHRRYKDFVCVRRRRRVSKELTPTGRAKLKKLN